MDRSILRVAAYAALMTDRYPPFRLDRGAGRYQPLACRRRIGGDGAARRPNIGIAPGSPFFVLPEDIPHVRVTVGLLRPAEADLVLEQLAAAAQAGRWGLSR